MKSAIKFMMALLLVLVILAAGPASAETAAMLIVKGDELFDQGDYQGALDAYNQSVAQDPNQPRAWVGLGSTQNVLKDYASALEALNKAIALNPGYAKAWYEKGNALYGLGQYQEAVTAYAKAVEIYPEYAYLGYYGEAKSYQALGEYQSALTYYDKAIQFRQDYAPAWNFRGETLVALGRNDEAKVSFETALSYSPGFPAAEQNLANLTGSTMTTLATTTPMTSSLLTVPATTTTETTMATTIPATVSPVPTRTTKAPLGGVIPILALSVALAGLILLSGKRVK
jgi:tetratricopeptide (TPR) repeat protein